MEAQLLKKSQSPQRPSWKGTRYLPVLIVTAMGGALLAGMMSYHLQPSAQYFPEGWRVANVDLSGASVTEANQRLQAFAREWEQTPLTITIQTSEGSTLWQTRVTRRQLGAEIDVEATLHRAWDEASRRPALLHRAITWLTTEEAKQSAPVVRIDEDALLTWLRQCQQQVETPPRDARLRYLAQGQWEAVAEKQGVRLATDSTQRLREALQRSEPTCLLTAEVVPPRVTRAHLAQIDSEWTSATTRYSERERDRSHNIRKAAESINGIVLLPGDIFSYNDVVGPRTLREGFRRAPVIVRGELVPDDGGGVCQVSTTLYIAALQAGLQIVQRSKHAIPIGYAPPGLDATVVYGAIDLRFRNNTPSPIALIAEAKGGKMTVRVLGGAQHKRTVQIQRVVHAVIPAPVKTFPTDKLPAGVTKVQNKGQRGWRVSVYRVIREPGKPPVREKVTTDYYRPQARVVLIGQGQPEQKTPPVVDPASSSPTEEHQL